MDQTEAAWLAGLYEGEGCAPPSSANERPNICVVGEPGRNDRQLLRGRLDLVQGR